MKYKWGRFYITSTCDVITPKNYGDCKFDDDEYAQEQLGQSLLLYCCGLALIARAKNFNDFQPKTGFYRFMLVMYRFGEIWKEYFDSDSQDVSLYQTPEIRKKKAYFWGITWRLEIENCLKSISTEIA